MIIMVFETLFCKNMVYIKKSTILRVLIFLLFVLFCIVLLFLLKTLIGHLPFILEIQSIAHSTLFSSSSACVQIEQIKFWEICTNLKHSIGICVGQFKNKTFEEIKWEW